MPFQTPLAAEISDGQKNEVFISGLSRAYKGSCEHPGGLHWRPKINIALYTSSIYPSTSPTIYLLLSSALSPYPLLTSRGLGEAESCFCVYSFFTYSLLGSASSIIKLDKVVRCCLDPVC